MKRRVNNSFAELERAVAQLKAAIAYAPVSERAADAERELRAYHRRRLQIPHPDYRWAYLLTLFVAKQRGEAIRPSDLVAEVRGPATTLLRVQAELFEGGLISLSVIPRDRRAQLVALTEEGEHRVIACLTDT